MRGTVAIAAGIWAWKISAHLRAFFIDLAIAIFAQVLAGEELLLLKHTERDQHFMDRFNIGNQSGCGRICLPFAILFLHAGEGIL